MHLPDIDPMEEVRVLDASMRAGHPLPHEGDVGAILVIFGWGENGLVRVPTLLELAETSEERRQQMYDMGATYAENHITVVGALLQVMAWSVTHKGPEKPDLDKEPPPSEHPRRMETVIYEMTSMHEDGPQFTFGRTPVLREGGEKTPIVGFGGLKLTQTEEGDGLAYAFYSGFALTAMESRKRDD
jgi:hypothetical protein